MGNCCNIGDAVATSPSEKASAAGGTYSGGLVGGLKHQGLILGMPKCGKTTLLYSWKIPHFIQGRNELPEDSSTDKADIVPFHYEEFRIKNLTLGVWDVKGSEAMQIVWSAFYRYLNIDVVFFVINMLKNEEILDAKRLLHVLFHEDELRDSTICIVLNYWDALTHEATTDLPCPEEVISRLGLHDAAALIDSNRWRIYSIRCLDITSGKDGADFEKMISSIYEILANHRK
eukprot:Filipodium_phascolosomae@DN3616_c0_g1_i1.p1